MSQVTKQTQEQRGQDRQVGQGSQTSTQQQTSTSSRSSSESARQTVSESQRASIEAGFEQVQTQKQHADLTISFRVRISGINPTRIHTL